MLWCIFALLQAVAFANIVPLSFYWVLADAILYAVLYGFSGILIWSVVRFGNFHTLPPYQRFINYSALAVLTVVVVAGAGYAGESIMGPVVVDKFSRFIYIRGIESLLIYVAFTQYYQLMMLRDDARSEESQIDTEPNDEPIKVAEQEQQPSDTEILERIALKNGQKIHVVLVQDIMCLQADGDYVHIYTMTGKYLKEQTMKYFEEHLPSAMFIRVHRSCIVNVEAISRIELYEKQSQQLTLKNGQQIKVSQTGYKALRQKLNL